MSIAHTFTLASFTPLVHFLCIHPPPLKINESLNLEDTIQGQLLVQILVFLATLKDCEDCHLSSETVLTTLWIVPAIICFKSSTIIPAPKKASHWPKWLQTSGPLEVCLQSQYCFLLNVIVLIVDFSFAFNTILSELLQAKLSQLTVPDPIRMNVTNLLCSNRRRGNQAVLENYCIIVAPK